MKMTWMQIANRVRKILNNNNNQQTLNVSKKYCYRLFSKNCPTIGFNNSGYYEDGWFELFLYIDAFKLEDCTKIEIKEYSDEDFS